MSENFDDTALSPANDPPRTRVPFSVTQQIEFTRKELRETLRDRRTIITLMVMPLLLYPLLGLGLQFLAFQQVDKTTVDYRIAIATKAEAVWLTETLQRGELAIENADSSIAPNVQLILPNDPGLFDLESTVTESAADLGIQIDLSEKPLARVKLYQNESSDRGREVARFVEKRFAAAHIAWIKDWAQSTGREVPAFLEQRDVQLRPAESGSAVLGLLPLILLLMTVTGGVYPAIDLTAGERERNTMETLMALPVPRFRLLAAKYVAVVTVTMLTGLMNILAMSMTLYALQLDKSLLGDQGFTIALALKLFLALSVFALFYSAVLLLLTSSARSFKEAQAYLIPLLLLSIAPGLVVLMPGWDLATTTAAIPLVNILLLSQALLQGEVQQLPAVVAILSTILYGMSALSLAAQVFGNDAVAVGSRGGWAEFFRRPQTMSPGPSLSIALSTVALLFPAFFIASGILGRVENAATVRLASSAIMTVGLFVVVPWLVLRWRRHPVPDSLGVAKKGALLWAAALLLGLATWPWVFEIVVVAHGWGIRGFDPSQIENVEALLAGWKSVPLWVVVLCMGVVPGVCEELSFRGYLFGALKRHLGAAATITSSAIAFGLFHVVLAGGAAPERILPSTLMGLLLGWVAWQCKSSVPAIILHAVHNSTLLIMVHSRDLLAQWNIGQTEQQHLPALWLLISAVLGLGGLLWVHFGNRQTAHSELPSTESALE
ncbi:MAG: CPBP family glutamic-type intramembrane protease [Planctomycetota bacterium]